MASVPAQCLVAVRRAEHWLSLVVPSPGFGVVTPDKGAACGSLLPRPMIWPPRARAPMLATAMDYGLGVIPWSPLHGGILGGDP